MVNPLDPLPSPTTISRIERVGRGVGRVTYIRLPRREGDNLALIAELIAPRIRMDNDNLEAENRVLRQDIRNLLRTSRDLANNNLNLQDTVRYLEGMTERLIQRVHRLEASILDCDDPSHDEGHRASVRRRLNYDSGSDLETHNYIFEEIDLTTDEVLTP